jgi:hypothetical protein
MQVHEYLNSLKRIVMNFHFFRALYTPFKTVCDHESGHILFKNKSKSVVWFVGSVFACFMASWVLHVTATSSAQTMFCRSVVL